MKTLFAMAVPILPGKTEQWKSFTTELKTTRFNEFAESRKKLGVRERTFLQTTPSGDYVVVTLEGEDPQSAFTKFGQGTDTFTKWFLSRVKDIHGIDLTSQPKGGLPELIIDTQAAVLQHN